MSLSGNLFHSDNQSFVKSNLNFMANIICAQNNTFITLFKLGMITIPYLNSFFHLVAI